MPANYFSMMIRNAVLFIGLILALAGCQSSTSKTAAVTLQAGAASAPVNPPMGSFIAGDKQNRTFTSVHDSLYAKAVVIDDGTNLMALVTIDCIGLLYPEVNRIREQASKLTPIPFDHIIVSSTHTHSGPDVVGLWGTDYEHTGRDSAYVSFLISTAAAQISKAYDQRVPVSVLTAESVYGEEWVANIADEEIDRSVTVMQFVNDTGATIATLTNFACHPTFMDAVFSHVSSDYVGSFYKSLSRLLPGEHLFLQGAIGGWVQPIKGKGTLEGAQLRGDELAKTVHQALQNPQVIADPALDFRSSIFRLPVANEAWQQLATIGTVQRVITDSLETTLAWFSVGTAQFATHPGETTPYLGLKTKGMMNSGPKFILGLSQDALGYILKPEFFEEPPKPHAEYLTRMSLGKQTSPLIEEQLRRIIPK
jgi:hypothetical protein